MEAKGLRRCRSVRFCLVEFNFDLFVLNLLKIKGKAESTCQCPGATGTKYHKICAARGFVNNNPKANKPLIHEKDRGRK